MTNASQEWSLPVLAGPRLRPNARFRVPVQGRTPLRHRPWARPRPRPAAARSTPGWLSWSACGMRLPAGPGAPPHVQTPLKAQQAAFSDEVGLTRGPACLVLHSFLPRPPARLPQGQVHRPGCGRPLGGAWVHRRRLHAHQPSLGGGVPAAGHRPGLPAAPPARPLPALRAQPRAGAGAAGRGRGAGLHALSSMHARPGPPLILVDTSP